MQTRLLTPALRAKLKSPLGKLIRGSFDETMRELGELVKREEPSMIVSVGDVVSENMIKQGILPQVIIVDNKVMRQAIKPIPVQAYQTLTVKNQSGTLTNEAWSVIQQALKQRRRTRVLVDGEEDLLTLVAVLHAPQNSFVIYGQPHEGIVVVKATEPKKKMVRQIVEGMESSFEKLNKGGAH